MNALPVRWMVTAVVVPSFVCALFALAPDFSPLGVAAALLPLLVTPPYPTMVQPDTVGRAGYAALAAVGLISLYGLALVVDAYFYHTSVVVNIGTGVVLCVATALVLGRTGERRAAAVPTLLSAVSVVGFLLGVAALREEHVLSGIAALLFAVAFLLFGIAVLRHDRVLAGAAVALGGASVVMAGVAVLRADEVRTGVAVLLVAVATVLLRVTFLRERHVLFFVALLVFGMVVLGEHQALIGVVALLLGVAVLVAGVWGLVVGLVSLLPRRGPKGRPRTVDSAWDRLTRSMPKDNALVKQSQSSPR